MPDIFDQYVKGGPQEDLDPFGAYEKTTTPAAPDTNPNGVDFGGAALGGAALIAAAIAARKPSLLGRLFRGANAVRQQAMLSGLALPKSMLGNTGAAISTSLERKSLSPLRELFSGQTVRDAIQAYKTGGHVGPTPGVTLPGPNPGKIMGALDEATQGALQRAGLTAKEAQREVLQAPLTGELGQVLEGPIAAHVLPFRRTPFNQFIEGWRTLSPSYAHKGVTAGYAATGAVHGAATADEQYPVSVPLATALASKYGLPYALAAVAARKLSGGEGGGGIVGSALPVSEYGVEQSLSDPFAPFVKPAASRFFE